MDDEAFDAINAAYQRIGSDRLFASQKLREDIATLDRGDAAFFTLVLVNAEIVNGGFSQVLTNSTGALVEEAIVGAEGFGLIDHAALLREALETLFPDGVPLDDEARLLAWDELIDDDDGDLDPQLDAFDRRWYALSDELERRLYQYATAPRGQ